MLSTCSLGRRLRPARGKSPYNCRDWPRPVRKRRLGECNEWRDPEMSRRLRDLSPAVTANSETSAPSVERTHNPGRWLSAASRFSLWEYAPDPPSRVGIYISAQATVPAPPVWTLFLEP